jgi:uncharacterized protein (DUF433 family)
MCARIVLTDVDADQGVPMSYPPALAATLSGATVRQLSYWRKHADAKPALFEPEFSRAPRVLYSYRDIVALRMFVQLREQLSLQKVRRAVQWLEQRFPETHLSAHRLKALPGGVSAVWFSPDGDVIDVVKQPGQIGFKVVLDDLLGEFTIGGRRVPDLGEPTQGISIDPDVRAGYPVIEGTRIPFTVVASLRADGLSAEEIAEFYPTVTPLEIEGAVELASWVSENKRQVAAG